jgi:hypothetical protein
MIPTFDDFAVVEHQYLISGDDSTQTMRYSDRRAPLQHDGQCVLNLRFDLTVDRAGRLVEKKQRCISRDGTRERQ